MANQLQHRYAMQISTKLLRFSVKQSHPYRMVFRCPICGDSQKSESKARGSLSEMKDGNFWFSCFNCGESLPFPKFLEAVDEAAFKDYSIDAFMEKGNVYKADVDKTPILENKKKKAPVANVLDKVKKISQLKHDHPAKQYVLRRQIPTSQHYKIYYAPKFKTWIRGIMPEMFPEVEYKTFQDEPRLLFPLIDKYGKCFGVNARSFDPKASLRYITIMFEDDKPKIFGQQGVDFDKPFYITEGPIDSMFLDNAVAMAGADGSAHTALRDGVFVFDNEPRNPDIHRRMAKLMKSGHKVCIWPKHIAQKDINDMHLAGVKNIQQIIDDNIFTGLSGEMKLAEWSKADGKRDRRY